MGRAPIAERETEYQQQRLKQVLSPARNDMFADKTPARGKLYF